MRPTVPKPPTGQLEPDRSRAPRALGLAVTMLKYVAVEPLKCGNPMTGTHCDSPLHSSPIEDQPAESPSLDRLYISRIHWKAIAKGHQ